MANVDAEARVEELKLQLPDAPAPVGFRSVVWEDQPGTDEIAAHRAS